MAREEHKIIDPLVQSSYKRISSHVQQIESCLELSGDADQNQNEYLNRIIETIQGIKDMAMILGFDEIEKLSSNLESFIKNRIDDPQSAVEDANNQVEKYLSAIKHLSDFDYTKQDNCQIVEKETARLIQQIFEPVENEIIDESDLNEIINSTQPLQTPEIGLIEEVESGTNNLISPLETLEVEADYTDISLSEETDTAEKSTDTKFSFRKKVFSIFNRQNNKESGVIGLDIGTSSLKIVVLKKKTDHLSLEDWRIYEFKPDDPESVKSETIKNSLFDFFNQHKKFEKLPTATSLISNSILIRFISLPAMSDHSFAKSAELEVQSELFFKESDIKLFTYPYKTHKAKKGDQKSGIVIAIEQHFLEQTLSVIKNAGIKPANLNIDLLVVGGLALRNTKETLALIDLGADKVKIVIIHDNEIQYARNIDSYENNLTTEISELTGNDYNAAEILKRNIQFSVENNGSEPTNLEEFKGERDSLQNIAFPILSNLVDAIQLTLQFYNSNHNHKVNAIKLVGGGALLNGVDKFLSTALNLPVAIYDALQGIEIDEEKPPTENLKRVSPRLATAIGLGMFQLQQSGMPKIDLRKKLKLKREVNKFHHINTLLGIVFLVLLTLSFHIFFKNQTGKLQSKIDSKNALLTELQNLTDNLTVYEELYNDTDLQIQNIYTLKKRQPEWSTLLKTISLNIPASIRLNQFNATCLELAESQSDEVEPEFDSDENISDSNNINPFLKVSFSGQSLSQDIIQEFISGLEKCDCFDYVNFNKISNQKKGSGEEMLFQVEGEIQIKE